MSHIYFLMNWKTLHCIENIRNQEIMSLSCIRRNPWFHCKNYRTWIWSGNWRIIYRIFRRNWSGFASKSRNSRFPPKGRKFPGFRSPSKGRGFWAVLDISSSDDIDFYIFCRFIYRAFINIPRNSRSTLLGRFYRFLNKNQSRIVRRRFRIQKGFIRHYV